MTVFGMTVEAATKNAVNNAKSRVAAQRAYQQTMDKYLYCDAPAQAPGRFRDPAAR